MKIKLVYYALYSNIKTEKAPGQKCLTNWVRLPLYFVVLFSTLFFFPIFFLFLIIAPDAGVSRFFFCFSSPFTHFCRLSPASYGVISDHRNIRFHKRPLPNDHLSGEPRRRLSLVSIEKCLIFQNKISAWDEIVPFRWWLALHSFRPPGATSCWKKKEEANCVGVCRICDVRGKRELQRMSKISSFNGKMRTESIINLIALWSCRFSVA